MRPRNSRQILDAAGDRGRGTMQLLETTHEVCNSTVQRATPRADTGHRRFIWRQQAAGTWDDTLRWMRSRHGSTVTVRVMPLRAAGLPGRSSTRRARVRPPLHATRPATPSLDEAPGEARPE
jgi:hypothetical protein